MLNSQNCDCFFFRAENLSNWVFGIAQFFAFEILRAALPEALPTFQTYGWLFSCPVQSRQQSSSEQKHKAGHRRVLLASAKHALICKACWPHYPQVEVWFKTYTPQDDDKWFQPVWDGYQCEGNGMAGSPLRGPMKAATSSESPNQQTVLSLTNPDNLTGKKARVS